jgi:RND family efflux transporter MFP subunit
MSPNEDKPIKPNDGNGPVRSSEIRIDSNLKDENSIGKNTASPRSSASSIPILVASGNPIVQPTNGVADCTIADLNDVGDFKSVPTSSVQIVDNSESGTATNRPQQRGSWFAPVWEVLKLFLIPALILSAFVLCIALLGVAQRSGWINSANGGGDANMVGSTSEEASSTSYICPMMCVPPTTKPGRCPVCAMELVPAAAGSSDGPSTKIQIDPRSRRVAGIQTVVAKTETLFREVRGVGEISYDESKLKTLSAYIDGRIEELYADYTGVEVKKGDSLALIYSPDLYAAQVSYSRTLEFAENASNGNSRTADSNRRLVDSSRQRLIELGMTEEQIKTLERDKTPNSRLALHAPMSGTVIEKMAVAGQYIKTGMPVYKLADLSSVWLVMELFPEDARLIQLGQKVIATTQSMQGQPCEGIVEFVEPTVDPKMRTVGIRVAINNEHGHLKPGEFIRATLKIPLLSQDGAAQETVVVPRNSLLSIGQTSLVYVEGKPGEFELRHVKTGPTVDGQVAIFEGLAAGENVVARSTFLLDAQMQLQGNPSLMDPDKAVAVDPKDVALTEAELEEIRKAMEPLSESDRQLAEAQLICPVTEVRLGSMGMGTPIKLEIEGRTVFICCEGCRDGWVNDPDKYFRILDDHLSGKSSSSKPTLKSSTQKSEGDLPQLELPQMNLPQMKLPGG